MNIKIPIPVYFAIEEETLSAIHDSLSSSAQRERESTVTASEWWGSVGRYLLRKEERERGREGEREGGREE